jgi:hypothetical protein
MDTSKMLQIGKAGEYIVCADLILKGFVSFPSEQGLCYDVLLDTGKKISRIQVKTTQCPREIPQRNIKTLAYMFNLKRHGKLNRATYSENSIDYFALVCLDTMQVGYIKAIDGLRSMNFRVDTIRGTYYDEKGVVDYNSCIDLYKSIKNKSEIARRLGLDIATVHRYLSDGHKPHLTNARYFSDIKRDKTWFLK